MKQAISILSKTFHCLQTERGCTALFLGSKGKQFSDMMSKQFIETDSQIKNLKLSFRIWQYDELINSEQKQKLKDLIKELSKLETIRGQINNFVLSAPDALNYYTHCLISTLIRLMVEMALSIENHHPTAVSAYNYFLQWKEKIGLERAISLRGFISHNFSNAEFLERILFILGEQESLKESFLSLATIEQKKLVTSISKISAVKKLHTIQQELKTSPNSHILKEMQAKDWFKIISDKIDALHILEQQLVLTLDGTHQLSNTNQSNITPDKNEYFDFIRALPIFANVNKSQITSLINQGKIYSAPKNKILFFENSLITHLHIILKGWVKIYKNTADGKEVVLQMLDSKNSILGATVFSNQYFHASAQMASDTVLFSLPAMVINKYIHNNTNVALNLLSNISAHTQTLDQEIESIKLRTAKQRVGYFLLNLLLKQNWASNKIQLPYSKSLIASYLSMNRETLSRAINSLKQQNFTIKKDTLSIPDQYTLCEYCDIRTAENCSKLQSVKCRSNLSRPKNRLRH